MPKVVMYTKTHCPYCVRAKGLLERKGVAVEEINIEGKDDEYAALKKRTGMMTVPQIFIGEKLVGGYTDLAALDAEGKLDPMLSAD
jgi:glutaredoxin 3